MLHCQCGERLIVQVKLHHALEINGAHHVDVMEKKRFRCRTGIIKKKPPGLFEAATSIEQQVLARHFYVHAEIFALPEERDHFVGEVMHVYDHVVNPESTQASKCDFEQGAPANFD